MGQAVGAPRAILG